MSFSWCHDYQLEGVAAILDKRDFVGVSATGSGKSAYAYMAWYVIQGLQADPFVHLPNSHLVPLLGGEISFRCGRSQRWLQCSTILDPQITTIYDSCQNTMPCCFVAMRYLLLKLHIIITWLVSAVTVITSVDNFWVVTTISSLPVSTKRSVWGRARMAN